MPPPLAVRSGRTRVWFDGRTLWIDRWTVAPGHWPLPRRRMLHQLALPDFTYVRFVSTHNSAYLPNLSPVRIESAAAPDAIVHIPPRSSVRAWALATTVNEARAAWMRQILLHSVGLGPWSETTWERIGDEMRSCGIPEDYYPGIPRRGPPPYYSSQSVRYRFERILTELLKPRPVDPYHALSTKDPRTSQVWNRLLIYLAGGQDVTATPQWQAVADDLLQWGHTAARGSYHSPIR